MFKIAFTLCMLALSTIAGAQQAIPGKSLATDLTKVYVELPSAREILRVYLQHAYEKQLDRSYVAAPDKNEVEMFCPRFSYETLQMTRQGWEVRAVGSYTFVVAPEPPHRPNWERETARVMVRCGITHTVSIQLMRVFPSHFVEVYRAGRMSEGHFNPLKDPNTPDMRIIGELARLTIVP